MRPRVPAHVNGSIDLINCLGTRNLFLSKDRVYPGDSSFSCRAKVIQIGSIAERGGKTGAIPAEEKGSGMGISRWNLFSDGNEDKSVTKDARNDGVGGTRGKDLINFSGGVH